MIGTVKRLPAGKSFGFIRGFPNGVEYFFHKEDCLNDDFDEMIEGNQVEFENQDQTPKGPRASYVRKTQ